MSPHTSPLALYNEIKRIGTLVAALETDTPATDPVVSEDSLLIGWADGECYSFVLVSRDSDDVITTASIVWPDGSIGTFTTTAKNTTFNAVDAATLTHAGSGKVITQGPFVRNAQGYVISSPETTIA